LDLTEGSETSAKLNLTPRKYPKENIQVSEHGENLKLRIIITATIYPEHNRELSKPRHFKNNNLLTVKTAALNVVL
jgi:hypothetical protein